MDSYETTPGSTYTLQYVRYLTFHWHLIMSLCYREMVESAFKINEIRGLKLLSTGGQSIIDKSTLASSRDKKKE